MHKVLELTSDVKKSKGTILGKLNGKAVCLPLPHLYESECGGLWLQRFHEEPAPMSETLSSRRVARGIDGREKA